LPVPGYRLPDNGAISSIGEYGLYWSSTLVDIGWTDALECYLPLSSVSIIDGLVKSHGFSIRCVKN